MRRPSLLMLVNTRVRPPAETPGCHLTPHTGSLCSPSRMLLRNRGSLLCKPQKSALFYPC